MATSDPSSAITKENLRWPQQGECWSPQFLPLC
jgi:hypothetical protein